MSIFLEIPDSVAQALKALQDEAGFYLSEQLRQVVIEEAGES